MSAQVQLRPSYKVFRDQVRERHHRNPDVSELAFQKTTVTLSYMKRTTKTFSAAVALTVVALSFPTLIVPQNSAQTEWNEQDRSEFEVPVGKTYTGRSPYMGRMAKSGKPSPPVTNTATVAKNASFSLSTTAPAPLPIHKSKPAAGKGSSAAASSSSSGAKSTCSESTSGLIRLSKTMPPEVGLGSEFTTELTTAAQGCAANVIVRDTIPAGVTYVKSEPAGTVEGNQLVWNIGNMDAGQSIKSKVVLKADREGVIVNCATVSADARVCGTTFVGKPVIAIDKTGPETAILGQDVTYNIVVKSTGTVAAKGVVVTDVVPTGMSHASAKSELSFDLGDLAPGQSKSLAVTFKANQRGKVCNTATVNSSNAGKVSDDACTTILVPGLKVEKAGTKEQILGRNADYEIVVSNTGDTTLQNVIVSETAPAETSIVTAPGATLAGNKATWTIAILAPGAKATQSVKLTSKTAGTHCNTVTASSGGISDSAKACTLWKGIAAVLLEVVDDPDPIQVGENTTYTIRVFNQGFADIHNVKITAMFGDQIMPVSSLQGSVSGKSVSFPVVAKIAAKQTVTYAIIVKGVSVGDSRNKIVLTSDELKSPVTEEESTTVY